MAMVRVEDHGPGVPELQREHIFEKFYRLPGASERSGGVGLGLSLVRSIAERHGGIDVTRASFENMVDEVAERTWASLQRLQTELRETEHLKAPFKMVSC